MHPLRNADIKTTLLPDGFVTLVSTKTDWAHTLNPTGALVWEFCDGEHSIEDICAEVKNIVTDLDPLELQDQVQTLVDNLKQAGLVEDRAPV